MSRRGLVLFAHGARDPRWAEPFERVCDRVAKVSPDVDIALAFLELMTPDLATAAAAMVGRGVDAITVVPIFLGVGAHVRRDLPERLVALRAAHPGVAIGLAGAAGEDDAVVAALADYCVRVGAPG